METLKIFLASSFELAPERKAFEDMLYQKSKIWQKDRKIFLELVNWEDFDDAMAATRLQNKYNEAIKQCNIFVLLFWTKVGKYTDEEFETARTSFLETGKPLIYTYFKETPAETVEPSLSIFLKKLDELGHFKTCFKNTEALLLHFIGQLERIITQFKPGAILSPSIPSAKKDTVLQLIDADLETAFQHLDPIFLESNPEYRDLTREYIAPPNNFSLHIFRSKLKRFVNLYFK